MPRYKYAAMDSKGGETSGEIDAESQAKAVAAIRARGLFPTKLTPTAAGPRASSGAKGLKTEIRLPRFLRGRVRTKQLMVLTRQLATLVDAGLPLLRGLRILLRQERNPTLREALSQIGEAVESGSNFSEALAQHPKIFDNLFVNMVRAGEAGGVQEVVLLRLAEFMEKGERIKNRIRSAMVYPVVVLVAAVGILSFLLTFVIPKFQEIFEDLLGDRGLPAITQFVIDVSTIVKTKGLWVVGGIALIWAGFVAFGRTRRGRLIVDGMKLKIPLFGGLMTKTSVARFARTLGTLMSSGVPVLQALNIVRDTSGNSVVAKAIQDVHDSVKEGDAMAVPLEACGVFPGMVVSMVDVGEETGALPDMLVKIADTYEDEVDTAVEGLTSIIEPVMIVFLAVIIGTIVIAMFVPLISIIGELSGGA
ncbi:MAG: type II secretion system F family protein [Lentisphaerae bacterium]|nr:type II secretion system F family protein [Lentisphaerota bacterium]